MMRKLLLSTLAVLLAIPCCAARGFADDQEASQILRKAIQAVGGERSFAALKSPMMWMQRGTFYGLGEGVPFVAQYAAKWPDWYRQEVENQFSITANGNNAWVTTAAGVQKLVGGQLEEILKQFRGAWAERLFPLMDKPYTLSRIDGMPVDGRPTVAIKASHPDGRDLKFFFDQETYLIAKVETLVISPQTGPEPVLSEAFYADHKSFGGGKLPSKVKLFYDRKLFLEGETIDYKLGATLDPKLFEGPE